MVVTRVERVPAAAQIGFKPTREIHRRVHRRHTDVAEISGAVASRNIHAAAEGDRKMRKVAAHAFSIVEGLQRRLGRAGVLVAELEMLMNEVANCLYAWPAGRGVGKQIPGR